MKDELQRRQSNTDKVLAYFRLCPGEWIGTAMLEKLGGRNAWRTRVADARRIVKAEGGQIENRQYRCESVIVSEYRFVPWTPVGPPADQYREVSLF